MIPQWVFLYVYDGLADWEAGYAVAGIQDPADQLNPGCYAVRTAGVSAQPVKTMGGITLLPDASLSEVRPEASAMLILPGGPGWTSGGHVEALDLARQFVAEGKTVAAICGATAGLARVGLLDHVHHTSNAAVFLQATGYQGGGLYQAAPAVTDGNIITAAGTAPLEFAYQIFKKLGLFSDSTLEAWYGLFKTGEMKYYLELQAKSQGS